MPQPPAKGAWNRIMAVIKANDADTKLLARLMRAEAEGDSSIIIIFFFDVCTEPRWWRVWWASATCFRSYNKFVCLHIVALLVLVCWLVSLFFCLSVLPAWQFLHSVILCISRCFQLIIKFLLSPLFVFPFSEWQAPSLSLPPRLLSHPRVSFFVPPVPALAPILALLFDPPRLPRPKYDDEGEEDLDQDDDGDVVPCLCFWLSSSSKCYHLIWFSCFLCCILCFSSSIADHVLWSRWWPVTISSFSVACL